MEPTSPTRAAKPYVQKGKSYPVACPGAMHHPDGRDFQRPLQSPGFGNSNESNQSNESWAARNIRSRDAVNLLDTSMGVGIITDYLETFFEDMEGGLKIFNNSLKAISYMLMGKRDHIMYDNVYAHGVDANLTNEELENPELAIKRGKINFVDDCLEDRMKSHEWGETILEPVWRAAAASARIKPMIYPVLGFLGEGYKNLALLAFETPGRLIWRLRFFSSSLHPRFATDVFGLVKHGIAGIFNKDHAKKYDEILTSLKDVAVDTLKDRNEHYGDEHDIESVEKGSRFGAAMKMWSARLKGHFDAAVDPIKAIETKIEKGTINKEDVVDRDTGKISAEAQNKERYTSITDLTGPFLGGLGIIGTLVFDPLQSILQVTGAEKGQKTLTFLSNLRRPASMLNYITRFTQKEALSQKELEEMFSLQELVQDGKATTASLLRYNALKDRVTNKYVGYGMTGMSLLESAFQIGDVFGAPERSALGKLSYKLFQRSSRVLFLRFFSLRRKIQGEQKFVESYVRERLGMKPGDSVKLEHYQKVDDGIDLIHNEAKDQMSKIQITSSADILDPVSRKINHFVEAFKSYFGHPSCSDLDEDLALAA